MTEMRDLGTSLKNSFTGICMYVIPSQTHLYEDNDAHKKQLTNKKYKTDVIAQNFTADCCAMAPLHLCLLFLVSNMLDSRKKCLDVSKKKKTQNKTKNPPKNPKSNWKHLPFLLKEIIRRQDY